MTSHHQISDVLDALAQHQLVVFVGARGTGKTQLLEQVYERLERSGVRVISLDAAAAQAASDLTAPLGELLGCAPDRLTATNLPEDARVRVLIDNCDALHEKTWFAAVQDEWRGVLGEPEARGRVALLVAGRPLFRHVAEGRGSPLVGIGSFLPSRPLTTTEIRKLGISELVAEKVRVKTGGHPQLTRRLVEAIGGDVDNLGSRYVEFATSQRRFLLQLIDDHGSAGRAVLADLLDAPRGTPVAQSAILARHFGGAGVLGEDTLSDLVASGLIEREGKSCRVAAEILRTDRDLRQYLAAPLFEITDEPTPALADASALLFRIENRLRRLLGEALAQIEETWWPSRFPASVVREVEQRRKTEAESVAPPSVQSHPVCYLTLGELLDAILEEANWEQVFRVRLGLSRDGFAQAAASMTAVRNKIAHNRPVDASDSTILRMAAQRLGVAITS